MDRNYYGLSSWKESISLQVVLAANDLPSINDITYTELIEVLTKVVELL